MFALGDRQRRAKLDRAAVIRSALDALRVLARARWTGGKDRHVLAVAVFSPPMGDSVDERRLHASVGQEFASLTAHREEESNENGARQSSNHGVVSTVGCAHCGANRTPGDGPPRAARWVAHGRVASVDHSASEGRFPEAHGASDSREMTNRVATAPFFASIETAIAALAAVRRGLGETFEQCAIACRGCVASGVVRVVDAGKTCSSESRAPRAFVHRALRRRRLRPAIDRNETEKIFRAM